MDTTLADMEMALYVINVALTLLTLMAMVAQMRRITPIPSPLFVFYVVFVAVIILPSVPVYLAKFSTFDMDRYFWSITVVHGIIATALVLDRRKHKGMVPSKRAGRQLSPIGGTVLFLALVAAYVGVAVYTLGADEFRRAIIGQTRPVPLRQMLWREILPRVPLGSWLRFMSKWGALTYGFYCFERRKIWQGWLLMAAALVAQGLELTKSGAVFFLIALLTYLLLTGKMRTSWLVAASPLVLLVGVFFARLEVGPQATFASAAGYFLYRVFGVPVEVSMIPYVLFPEGNQLGLTVLLLANLRGGYESLLGPGYMGYDNYLGRVFYGNPGAYGGANSSFFTYAHTDFGLIGVAAYTAVLVGALRGADRLLLSSQSWRAYYPVLAILTALVAGSQNLLDWLLGPEGLLGLGVVYGFIETIEGRDLRPGFIAFLWCGFTFYVATKLSTLMVG